MAYQKIPILLIIILISFGCNIPVDELAYRGRVPEQYEFDEARIQRYAEQLAKRIEYHSPELRRNYDSSSYEFLIRGHGKVNIVVIAYVSNRYLYASVFREGYRTEEAQRVLSFAQELFAEMFPPAKMERHVRMQGFPGV